MAACGTIATGTENLWTVKGYEKEEAMESCMKTASAGMWESVVQEMPDGSGDVFIPIPGELMDAMGWTADTELDVDVHPDSGTIVVRAAHGDAAL